MVFLIVFLKHQSGIPMRQLPPLRALQVFETVGHYESISRAAQHLGISVGAVSQHMRVLEESLDATLTVKEGQRIRLSPAGGRLHARCKVAFEELRSATAEVERMKNSATLYVSSLPSIMAKWLAPLMYEWNKNRRDIDTYLDSTLEDTSEAEGADFRIGYGPSIGDYDNRAELFRDCVVPVCASGIINGQAFVSNPRSLLEYPLISIESKPDFDSPPSWLDWFGDCGFTIDAQISMRLRLSSASVAVQAAIDGQGVVLAQYSMVAGDLNSGKLVVPLQHAMILPSAYYLSWNRSALHKPQCRDFQRWIVGRGREQQRVIKEVLGRNGSLC
jgi:LysR family glycine cleavage system transcriptional activator